MPVNLVATSGAGQIVIDDGSDRTPNTSFEGHLRIVGSGYSGGISLNATGMWVGHNVSTRTIIFATDETSRCTIENTGAFKATGEITAYSSDQRLKDEITPITDALDKINQISGVRFKWNNKATPYGFMYAGQTDVGVIAQQIQKVLPEVVKRAPFDDDGNGNSKTGENYLTVQYDKIVALLIEGIKELSVEVNNLKAEISELKNHKH